MLYVYTTILLCMQHVRGLQALCCTINLTSLDLTWRFQNLLRIIRQSDMCGLNSWRYSAICGKRSEMEKWVSTCIANGMSHTGFQCPTTLVFDIIQLVIIFVDVRMVNRSLTVHFCLSCKVSFSAERQRNDNFTAHRNSRKLHYKGPFISNDTGWQLLLIVALGSLL